MTYVIQIFTYLLCFLASIYAINIFYAFLFALFSKFKTADLGREAKDFSTIAVFIPAYRENVVIRETAFKAKQHAYAPGKSEIIVIADGLAQDTLEYLQSIGVVVFEVFFEKSTKAKSLQAALEHFKNRFEICVVLDVDNVMSDQFLYKINQSYQNGFKAIQGHRTAKNSNTPLAILDGVSEEINNSIYRKGHRAIGLSSALIGSAMAFQYDLYHKTMAHIHSIGEDKELELALLEQEVKIAYLPDALVFDEKTQKMSTFNKQRRRWLHSQWFIFKNYFWKGFKVLVQKGNVDYFNKSFQSFLIPRVLLLGFLPLTFGVSLLLPEKTLAIIFLSMLCFYVFSLFLAIPKSLLSMPLAKAVLYLPVVFANMFLLQFKLKGAGKNFGHTAHSYIEKPS